MNVDLFLDRIMFLAHNFGDRDARYITKTCLMDVEMPCDWDGYEYIASCAAFLHENPGAMITKHVYPAVAKEFGCSRTHVEASVRRVILEAHENRNERWFCYFSNKRPTNSEFITTMCEVLSFWEACRKCVIKGEKVNL